MPGARTSPCAPRGDRGVRARHGLGSPVLLEWAGDLVEAHIRAGSLERARRALAVLEREAAAPGRPLADAVLLRCSALLLGDDDAAAPAFAKALRRHAEAAPRPFEEARTRLAWASTCGAAAGSARPARRWPPRCAGSPGSARRRGRGARTPSCGRRARARPAAAARTPRRGDARGPRARGPAPARRRFAPRIRTAAAHPAGAAGGTRRRRRGDQRRGGRPAVPVAEDDRVPPVERLPQARHPVACRAGAGRAGGFPTPA